MRLLFFVFALLQLGFSADAVAYKTGEVVRETTQEVLARLDAEREELDANPEHIQIIVHELIVPHFDFNKMAQLVMGHYWQETDELEQACFTRGFRHLLVERYADILLSYDNQAITYEPAVSVGDEGYMLVRQTITREGAKPLPVDYPMRPVENGWKVVDIIVDGVSLVRNYRGIIQYEINKFGLAGFIRRFPACNE